MRVVLAALGLVACTGCARATEGMVREQAANAFACADYALHVEEVGPDVYRASGCGQELIYACAPVESRNGSRGDATVDEDPEEIGNAPRPAPIVCARRP